MKQFSTKSFLVFLIILFTLFSCVSGKTLSETFKKTISFNSGTLLTLSNSNGDVEISSWDKDDIEIVAYKKVRASNSETAEKMMEHLQILIHERDNEIEIETDHPRRSGGGRGFFDWMFGSGNSSYSVTYEIKIPREADLNINTTNGNVEVIKVTGRIRMESTNGEIIGKNITGLVRCKTTNGSIKVAIDEIPLEDEMNFRTTNGSIRLYLPRDYGGYIDLETTNGSIDCDFPVSMDKRKKRHYLRGQINSGDADLYCTTTNGSIKIYYND